VEPRAPEVTRPAEVTVITTRSPSRPRTAESSDWFSITQPWLVQLAIVVPSERERSSSDTSARRRLPRNQTISAITAAPTAAMITQIQPDVSLEVAWAAGVTVTPTVSELVIVTPGRVSVTVADGRVDVCCVPVGVCVAVARSPDAPLIEVEALFDTPLPPQLVSTNAVRTPMPKHTARRAPPITATAVHVVPADYRAERVPE